MPGKGFAIRTAGREREREREGRSMERGKRQQRTKGGRAGRREAGRRGGRNQVVLGNGQEERRCMHLPLIQVGSSGEEDVGESERWSVTPPPPPWRIRNESQGTYQKMFSFSNAEYRISHHPCLRERGKDRFRSRVPEPGGVRPLLSPLPLSLSKSLNNSGSVPLCPCTPFPLSRQLEHSPGTQPPMRLCWLVWDRDQTSGLESGLSQPRLWETLLPGSLASKLLADQAPGENKRHPCLEAGGGFGF